MKKTIKYITAVGLGIFIALGYLYAVKKDREKPKYRYIGTSIFETKETNTEALTIGQREYYEHLVEFKP